MNPADSQINTPAPWERNPYRLISWWEMAKFLGSNFCTICAHLSDLGWKEKSTQQILPDAAKSIKSTFTYIRELCEESGLINSAAFIKEYLPIVFSDGPPPTYGYANEILGTVHLQITSEMKRVEFIRVERQQYYGDIPLFAPFVPYIYSGLTYDIVEAGNCLALNRTTACVFHLMRIMEFGVQRLGEKLKVPIDVKQETWQTILNHVNGAINRMPDKPAAKKRMKENCAEVAGYLYHVKMAWRNTVMHPKRTYTPEEAEKIFENVKTFVGALIHLLKPKSVQSAIKAAEAAEIAKKAGPRLFGYSMYDFLNPQLQALRGVASGLAAIGPKSEGGREVKPYMPRIEFKNIFKISQGVLFFRFWLHLLAHVRPDSEQRNNKPERGFLQRSAYGFQPVRALSVRPFSGVQCVP